jgi:hypothetical protein
MLFTIALALNRTIGSTWICALKGWESTPKPSNSSGKLKLFIFAVI